jgi:hypothetical protein
MKAAWCPAVQVKVAVEQHPDRPSREGLPAHRVFALDPFDLQLSLELITQLVYANFTGSQVAIDQGEGRRKDREDPCETRVAQTRALSWFSHHVKSAGQGD